MAYRDGIVRCPGCASIMRREAVPSAEVDVCDACGGLWVDWFDGEVQTLAAEAEAVRVDRGTPLPSSPHAERGTCPRCMRGLDADHIRFADATDRELLTGVDLLRCGECLGAFVPRSSAHLLLDRTREPRAMTLLEVLIELVRRLRCRVWEPSKNT